MRYCCQRLQTDRNTPSRFKIDFLFFKYNGFFCYNGFITDFFGFYRFLTFLRTKKTWMPPRLGVQFWGAFWGHENELSTKFWGSGLTYKRVGALED